MTPQMSPKLIIAVAVSAAAVVVLVLLTLRGGDDRGERTPTTTATTTTTIPAAAAQTIAPAPIAILPDWYRKGSSRYDERRPTTTVGPTSTVVPTSTLSAGFPDVLGRSEILDLLERHGLEARRSLGQNFVVDPGTVESIARLAGVGPGDRVVEVGPGLGSLTLVLLAAGAEVTALEKDRTLVPVLMEVLADAARSDPSVAERIRLVEGDALRVDWSDVLGPGEWTLVANLPYNVAVPVLMGVLAGAPAVRRLVVMVQAEVAERLCADPGDRTIGIPTIKVAWYGSARILKSVGPEVFVPRPRVRSAVVGIDRRPPPSEVVGPRQVFPLVERAYNQRRKMLRSTLSAVVAPEQFDAAGIDGRLRPERLGLEDWVRLAEVVEEGRT